MTFVVTVLEGRVALERTAELQVGYAETARGPFPPGLVRSTLLRHATDPTLWRIETIWQSHEALAAMRRSGKPRGVQLFELAGAEPSLSVFDAIAEVAPDKGVA